MRKRGFSLIEMLIVIVLISLIVAMGLPRLRSTVEKQNIRSAKALLATLVATARGVAVQRGCAATLNLSVDSAWVTACGVNPPAASVQVGTKKLVGGEFGVTLAPSAATVTYDPRGLATVFQTVSIRITGPNYQDSVVINQVGKVIRQ